jgi:hypothetical protein
MEKSVHKCGVNRNLQSDLVLLYVQVTVHRDNLRINNQQEASSIPNFYFVTKLYTFRASSVPIVRSYQPYARQLVCFMQVMWPLPRRVRLELQVQKHVEFHDKIKILDT